MLYKKELAAIPLLSFPKTTQKELQGCSFTASANVCSLPKSGDVLAVDIFNTQTRTVELRFFSDGVTYLVCTGYPAQEWRQRNPINMIGYGDIASNKQDDEMVSDFLKAGRDSWRYGHTLASHLYGFAYTVYTKKQRQAADRKYALMEEHFNMFPDYPPELTLYCENHVFEHTYIFINKAEKGYRKAVCGHCQQKFRLKKDEAQSGRFGNCPKCGVYGKYRGTWLNNSIKDKAKICIAHKVNGQLIIRWINIHRTFIKTKYRYCFDDYYRTLHLHTPKGDTIYSYVYMSLMGYGYGWYRKKNGTLNFNRTHIFTLNLNEVFSASYYHVNLQSGLKSAGKISFNGLLDNLKNLPAAEYLFKTGLSNLAANVYAEDLHAGNGFSQVLGVNQQYLSLYRKYNVDVYEHKIIKAAKTWVSEESFIKFRTLKIEQNDTSDIIDLLEQMSFERFVNYFAKQKSLIKRKIKFLLQLYKDYISMAKSLKADLSRKSVSFPKNIKESHDLIVERYNKIKHEVENENFKQAVEKLYSGLSEYTKDSLCILFPKQRSDLITEGQSLNHCVGAETYYKNHIEGIRMVFFIRQITEPEKSFFTMEIDMRELRIRQLYGFGGCSPSVDVRKFANEFLRRLQPRT